MILELYEFVDLFHSDSQQGVGQLAEVAVQRDGLYQQ